MAKLVLPLRLRDVFLIWQGAGLSLRTVLLERKVEIDRDQIEGWIEYPIDPSALVQSNLVHLPD